MTSIAGGTFNGESAVAIGISMVSESGGWVYKLQGTSNSRAITLQLLALASSGNGVTILPTSKAMALCHCLFTSLCCPHPLIGPTNSR